MTPTSSTELAAVLWDMDGTLVDTEPLWLQAEVAMLDRFGIAMTPEINERLIGSGLTDAAEYFRSLGVRMSVEEIINEWVAGVSRGLAAEGPRWRPGAVELLESLRSAGVPCALVTMSVRSFADQIISLLPHGCFQAVVAGDEVEFEKPHPDPYLRGARALDVDISHCIAIEDSPTGLAAAFAAQAMAIGVPHLLPLDDAPHHSLLSTLSGIDAAHLKEMFSLHRSPITH